MASCLESWPGARIVWRLSYLSSLSRPHWFRITRQLRYQTNELPVVANLNLKFTISFLYLYRFFIYKKRHLPTSWKVPWNVLIDWYSISKEISVPYCIRKRINSQRLQQLTFWEIYLWILSTSNPSKYFYINVLWIPVWIKMYEKVLKMILLEPIWTSIIDVSWIHFAYCLCRYFFVTQTVHKLNTPLVWLCSSNVRLLC